MKSPRVQKRGQNSEIEAPMPTLLKIPLRAPDSRKIFGKKAAQSAAFFS